MPGLVGRIGQMGSIASIVITTTSKFQSPTRQTGRALRVGESVLDEIRQKPPRRSLALVRTYHLTLQREQRRYGVQTNGSE